MDSAASHAAMRSSLRRAFHAGLVLPHGTEAHLAGALHHTLEHPGSMVRAELAFRIASSFGMSEERAENLAIAIEYFHTASLLFDDLPAMDDAELRRGVPCAHHVYGEGAAILAAAGAHQPGLLPDVEIGCRPAFQNPGRRAHLS